LSADFLDRVDREANRAKEAGVSQARAVIEKFGPISESRARGWIAEAAKRRQPKRPPRVDFKEVADVARAAQTARSDPINAVRDYFQTSERYAAQWIERATARGYLPPTKRRKRQ
jgi:hypothetical protein